ncbi:hypothetical protein G173_gp148 [Erwinia phage phiEaH2]|uniref:Uncharacterized protein n=2 Tax=Erskinevirus EaH2 TaxID=2169883 RepID=J7KHJ8_9CAUD|nr:hypothetical protein G173_gp148 [Erwinia phage phiEaH2]AFQ96693.1 hypothetical protein [Erwinia phage phiEaH2]
MMNKIAFEKGTGLIVNEVIIPNTDNAAWEHLALRLNGKKVSVTLTNELALNGNLANAGPEFAAFNVPHSTGVCFLKNAYFASRVYSWKLLAELNKSVGLNAKQGVPNDHIANHGIVIVVSRVAGEELAFSFCYAYGAQDAAA